MTGQGSLCRHAGTKHLPAVDGVEKKLWQSEAAPDFRTLYQSKQRLKFRDPNSNHSYEKQLTDFLSKSDFSFTGA